MTKRAKLFGRIGHPVVGERIVELSIELPPLPAPEPWDGVWRDVDGNPIRPGDELLALRDGADADYRVEVVTTDSERIICRRIRLGLDSYLYGMLECAREWRVVSSAY